MMMNLFSVFDPVVLGWQFNWISVFTLFLFFPFSYYLIQGWLFSVMFLILKFSVLGLKEMSVPWNVGLVFFSCSVFLFLVLNNVLGLFSFVFTSTAHPVFTLSMGLVYWFSFVIMGWVTGFYKSVAHLVPEGSPLLLAPVLVLIELISHLIRPFTLSIRLAANMMAGHLIVGLLASISFVSFFSFFVSFVLQLILFILEVGVAVIQGLVFSILLILYALDYY